MFTIKYEGLSDITRLRHDFTMIGKDAARGRMLIRQESTHGLGIHSDDEDSSDEDGHDHHLGKHAKHRASEHSHTVSVSGEDSKLSRQAPLGSGRDRKTVAEKLQAAFGYPEQEELIGGKTIFRISVADSIRLL